MFQQYESVVRSYCNNISALFARAQGHHLYDANGTAYLDFLAGAGALNYGHNNELMKQAVLAYINGNGVMHSLDLHTVAKLEFINAFVENILKPRNLDYKLQFTGPTGTNAVEAALKLARKVTGRKRVIAFTGAFHGMTAAALACSAKEDYEGLPSGLDVMRFPFDGFSEGTGLDTLEKLLSHPGGVAKPAAFILETLQCEGGLNKASNQWLQQLSAMAKRHGILLIADEIQVGCGRTGSFFSFERAGIEPDIVCLSKSISGMGLPMALVLLKPQYDIWKPGEHNGTFRGNNLAFVAATIALEHYWRDNVFVEHIAAISAHLHTRLCLLQAEFAAHITAVRGLGMAQGISFTQTEMAAKVAKAAYRQGLIIECCGGFDEVLKFMPPLTVTTKEVDQAVDIVHASLVAVLREHYQCA